jgi:hypothetical protein
MDTYGEAIADTLGAIGKICEIDRTLLLAAFSGGNITSMLLGHLAACGGQDRIAGLGLRHRDGRDLPVVPPIVKRRSNYQRSAVR